MTTYPVPLEKRLADMLSTLQRRVTLLESRTSGIDTSPTAVGGRQYVFKGADQNLTSSTTFTNDTVLTVPLIANATYNVEIEAHCAGPANGIQTSWSVPAGTTGCKMCTGPTSVVADGQSRGDTKMRIQGSTTLNNGTSYSVDLVNSTVIHERGLITTAATAGPVTFQWAQITSSATATTMFAGSYMIVTRLG